MLGSDSPFNTRGLTGDEINYNINKWWGKKNNIHNVAWTGDVTILDVVFGKAQAFAQRIKDAACDQLDAWSGVKVCSTLEKIGRDCAGLLGSGQNAGSVLVDLLFGGSEKAFQTLINGIGAGFKQFADPERFLTRLGEAFKVWTGLEAVDFDGLVDAVFSGFDLQKFVSVIADTFGWTISDIIAIADKIVPGAVGLIMTAAGAIQGLAEKGIDGSVNYIKNTLGDWATEAFSFVNDISELLRSDLGSIIENIISKLLPDILKSVATKVGTGGLGVVVKVVQGFLKGCQDMACLLNGFVNSVKAATEGKSAGDIGDTIATALEDALVPILKFVAHLVPGAERLPKTISDTIESLRKKAQILRKVVAGHSQADYSSRDQQR